MKKNLLYIFALISAWVVFLLPGGTAFGAIAFVRQATSTVGSDTSSSVQLASNPGAGDALVLCINLNLSANVSTVTGGGVTWNKAYSLTGGTVTNEIWYGLNSNGTTSTVKITATVAADMEENVSEYIGVAASSAFDTSSTATATFSVTPTTGTSTTSNANDLLVGCMGTLGVSTITAGPTNSFTELASSTGASSELMSAAYRIVSATSSYSTQWTLLSADTWTAGMVALTAVPPTTHGIHVRGGGTRKGRVKARAGGKINKVKVRGGGK